MAIVVVALMKMSLFICAFIVFCSIAESTLKLKKCCQRSEVFDINNLSCVLKSNKFIGATPLIPQIMINKTVQDQSLTFVETNLTLNELSIGLISCPETLKVLKMSNIFDYALTTDGDLISLTGAYVPSFAIGDFCIELAFDENKNILKRIALTCDPCLQDGISCVRACCSHFNLGQVSDDKNFSCIFTDQVSPSLNPPIWSPSFRVGPEVALVYEGRFDRCSQNQDYPKTETIGPETNSTYRLKFFFIISVAVYLKEAYMKTSKL